MAFGQNDAEERQIKRLYAAIYNLGMDPKVWKKEHSIASYAKMTWEERSKWISELEEQAKKQNENANSDDVAFDEQKYVDVEANYKPVKDEAQEEADMQRYAARMKIAVHEAVQIALDEVEEKIPNQGLGGFIKDIAIAMFREPRLEKEGELKALSSIEREYKERTELVDHGVGALWDISNDLKAIRAQIAKGKEEK